MQVNLPVQSAAMIAIEAASNPFSMISEHIKDNLMSLTQGFSDSVSGFVKRFDEMNYVSGKAASVSLPRNVVNDVTVLIQKESYLDVAEVQVPTPVGFNGRYLEYTMALSEVFDGLYDIDEQVLAPTEQIIGMVLSHPDKASGITMDNVSRKLNVPTASLDKLTNTVTENFIKDGTSQQQNFETLFERNTDVGAYLREAMLLSRKYSDKPSAKIVKRIKVIGELSDLLYVRLKNGQLTEVQNTQASTIAKLLADCARVVETYAALCSLIEEDIAFAGNVYNHIMSVMKRQQA